MNAAVFAAGLWFRDLIVVLASGAGGEDMVRRLAVWAPLHALTTAIAGVIVLIVFRDWLDIRLEE